MGREYCALACTESSPSPSWTWELFASIARASRLGDDPKVGGGRMLCLVEYFGEPWAGPIVREFQWIESTMFLRIPSDVGWTCTRPTSIVGLLAGPCAKCNNLFPNRILSYKTVIINGEDVLPFGNEEAEAATSGALEGNTACLRSQDSIHVIPIIELIVEPLRHPNHLCWISILYCY